MKIAVLSGKGGTGKTTVAASIAEVCLTCQYLDCDVEEPNGALFLQPEIQSVEPVMVYVPEISTALCDGCGNCLEACQFNALAKVGKQFVLFPELCHHCGACLLSCPQNAIAEIERVVGFIESSADGLFHQGKLNIGEPISIPVVHELKRKMQTGVTTILDCPPGASCTVVAAVADTDWAIVVAEPTPFGLHDLKVAAELLQTMGIPFGVIINKAIREDLTVQSFCKTQGIPLLLEIPFSREIAEDYSQGRLPVHSYSYWRLKFMEILTKVEGDGSQ